MAKKMLVADLLCGAGGSSTGAARALKALGLEMELVCLNHWPTAIETHTKNHPEARHYVQDIATVRPHLVVPEGYLDLLMASPSCTHHSVARGGKPTSDQQRSDPWHIITWFTELRVKRAIIENVWEFTNWGPVDHRTGKPIKSRKGEYFRAWVDTIWKCGATSIEWRKLNAADYGDATTRQRFIMFIRFDGKSLSWPVQTHRKREVGRLELFPGMKPWRPAREIIDWEIKGRSILTRKKPLAAKTLARIYAGAEKFGWPEPYLVILRNHMAGHSLDAPLPTIAANGQHIGLAEPVVLSTRQHTGGPTPRSAGEPIPTLTATDSRIAVAEAVVVNMKKGAAPASPDAPLPTQTAEASHIAVAEPVIMNGRRGNIAKAVSTDPLPTLDTKGGVWLAEPLVLSQHNSGAARSAEEPLPTITTGGAAAPDHPGCARPMLVTVAHGNDDRTSDLRRSHSIEEPLGTVSAGGVQVGVVEPSFILSQGAGGAPRGVDEPVPTVPGGGAHALISPYYGSGSGETCSSTEDALPTVTAKARFAMVVPVTQSGGGATARDADTQPLPTLTTARGGEFAVVVPVTHAGGDDRVLDPSEAPLPTITGANRGELAFITAQHGERPGQAPRVHDIDQPAPAIAATGHVDLVEPTEHYDILFRMLEPHELAAAMGFTTEDETYEFAGTKTEKIKQIGNAVSVRKMEACVLSMMADAAPKAAKKVAVSAAKKAA